MILSSNPIPQNKEFENLLASSQLILEEQNKNTPAYFSKRTPTEFEKDVHAAMCEASVGTSFENTLELVSGHRFPDIIVNNFYGVEVKTAQKGWKSTGNSVLESTRVDKIERIYLFFGRLSRPAFFKFRKYEECLYEVAVTHSPRYLIDMELGIGNSIFDKIKVAYDDLRKLEKPIKPFINYYRETAKPGQEPWWMEGAGGDEDVVLKPTISLWKSLSPQEKEAIILDAMVYFPQIFGTSTQKYQELALWLASRKGVINPNLRDGFTAGGQVTIEVDGHSYRNIPKIFFHLSNNLSEIIKRVAALDIDDATYFWKPKNPLSKRKLLSTWIDLVLESASKSLKGKNKFIVHLLGNCVGSKRSSAFLKQEMAKNKLNFSA